jgi:hypothetical protein
VEAVVAKRVSQKVVAEDLELEGCPFPKQEVIGFLWE